MFTIKNYVVAESLEQAYELNQKKNNVILGGTAWLKMGNRNIQTAIDLSNLGLDTIEEDDESFKIGCMCTLRQLEVDKNLNSYFDGAIEKSLIHIVGVQFRNCATIGGSVYSRFGFSDVLTCLLALDTYVELYKGGIIPLEVYKDMDYDTDVLVRIIIKKDKRRVSYLTMRNSATDIPTLAIAVSKKNLTWNVVIGARPQRAILIDGTEFLSDIPTEEEKNNLIFHIVNNVKFQSNMRASMEYRVLLAKTLVLRAINETLS
ncbi:FAD binding domain-containing protein [Clostridium butyricum]|uniref:FAD binding domain-containing protein n=1 Tax=Clostridium butyricum TaxID=1492 RepID=UPI00071BC5D5|nr:FAD binding domain-containing protein [Clostridium butyricum]ALP90636.1 molybdopterin dehydrogenase [Clostridium butyricum]ALS17142.1 molybdopterin dehydrogenase [Clostridium butyricum]ANF14259.1 molybdopterin dehydrogenase [Clostridium butyricum]AOR94324.1 molybdopterin dehydrogenase [Clostridium butyricum]MCI3008461.1 FAD binding domain-containing protein [Clostridium butyricum]